MSTLEAASTALASAAAACVDAVRAEGPDLGHDALLSILSELASSVRLVDVASSVLASEVSRRSAPEYGQDGLARQRGARTPDRLIQIVTGVSGSTARRQVRVGDMFDNLAAHEADIRVAEEQPWLAEVLHAAALGVVSSEAVEAIRVGLGSPSEGAHPVGVSADALAGAARALLHLATTITIENLAARAREARDDLDANCVAVREEERRERRYLRLIPLLDGMTRITGLLDPESAAVVSAAVDAATSPRRGGPRFVDLTEAARAQRVIDDKRTTEQLALDALVELIDVATRGNSRNVLGARRPEVRVLVTKSDLDSGVGAAFIEGQKASVSVATAQRIGCDSGFIPVLFDDTGQSLAVGHTRRFHDARQRTAIAARDGGCIHPDCDRPPSWSEVHHINEYARHGETNVPDGVLLCRFHHLLLHNLGWRIVRREGKYVLVPPPSTEETHDTQLSTKSPALRRLLRAS